MDTMPTHIGRYRLVRRLGRGAMGEVYHAVLEGRQGFRKEVALKLLAEARYPDSDDLQALFHEARLGAMLSHPNVVAIHELGQHEGRWFVSMELVRGPTVHELQRTCRLEPAQVVEIGLQTAAGLAHIHGLCFEGRPAGLVHRDVKPANLLVDPHGMVKLADLGIARLGGTRSFVAGSPGYMPPEQTQGDEDHRADLFALGVVLYRLATGVAPFGRGGAALIAVFKADERLGDPDFLAPVDAAVPGLGEVLRRCLAFDPDRRYPDATALYGALRRLQGHLPTAPPLHTLATDAPSRSSGGPPSGSSPRSAGSDEPTRLLAPGNLPGRADRFVGREDEREQLVGLARAHRLVTLVGPGGMGKTRLSLEAGRAMSRRWEGGTWFVDLSEARTGTGISAAVARVFDVPLRGDDATAQVGHALAGRGALLLILDNLEQVVDDAIQVVRSWLALAPEATLLCTSQVPLRLPEERVLSLGPLSIAEGADLFVERAPRPPPAEQREAVEQLVGLLDGLPLAVELAAARTRVLAVPAILDRLHDRFRVLAGGGSHLPARQRSLSASLDASYELLPPWGAGAMGQLAVFQDGFTLEAAEAVIDLEAWRDAPWALDLLDTLVAHSLLRFEPESGRFRMLHTIQAYATEHVDERVRREAEARHGAWYAQLGGPEALDALSRHGGVERRKGLRDELDNLLVATRRAVARHDGGVAVRACLAAFTVLTLTGPMSSILGILDEVMALPDALGDLGLQLARATTLRHQGRLEDGIAASRALVEAARAADHPIAAEALVLLGASLGEVGRSEEALLVCVDAIATAEASRDPYRKAQAYRLKGNLHRLRGEMEEARAAVRLAIPIYQQIGDVRGEAIATGNLATALELGGFTEEALAHYHRALELDRITGDRRNEASVLSNMGSLHLGLGKVAEARRLMQASVRLHRDVGNRCSASCTGS